MSKSESIRKVVENVVNNFVVSHNQKGAIQIQTLGLDDELAIAFDPEKRTAYLNLNTLIVRAPEREDQVGYPMITSEQDVDIFDALKLAVTATLDEMQVRYELTGITHQDQLRIRTAE